MSDAYQADTANPEPTPAETITLQQENLDAWRQHQREQGLEVDPRLPEPAPMSPAEIADAASGRTSDDAVAREMGRELRKQREREGHDWEDKAPIVTVKAGAESYKDVRAATRERTDTRELAEKDALLRAGLDENLADAIASKHRDRLIRAGVAREVVDEIIDPSPPAVPMAKPDGQPIDPEEVFDNVWSATKAVRNGRAVVEAARQQWEAEQQQQLSQYQQQQAPEPEVAQPAPPAQTQGPTPEQQQAAEALAAEEWRLRNERAALAMTQEERAIRGKVAEWDRWLATTPEATSQESWAWTQANNPKRAAQLAGDFAKARQARDVYGKRLSELNEIRQHRSQQWNAVQAAARDQLNTQYDNQFAQMLEKEMPELSRGPALKQLQAAAHDELRAQGLTDQQITAAWRFGALREPAAQMVVARAAKLRLMEQKTSQRELAKHRQRVPAPQVPGVWAPRGADHAEERARLERQLEGQQGNRALMTATRLQQLRRADGLA